MDCIFDDSKDELFVIMNRIWGGQTEAEMEIVDRNADGLELAFKDIEGKKWFRNGYRGFHLFLFVAGPIWDQSGNEGPRRLSTGRDPKSFRIDLVVPTHAYQGKTTTEFRPYFFKAVSECIELMLKGAVRRKHVADEAGLRAVIDAALQRYQQVPLPPFRPPRRPKYDSDAVAECIEGSRHS